MSIEISGIREDIKRFIVPLVVNFLL